MSKARDLANAGTALTSVSATELGYLDGVTSAVQTQIDAKAASSAPTLTSPIVISPEERTTVSATAATGTVNFDASTQGVLYYTTNASGNWTLNVRGTSSTTLDSILAVGDAITVSFLVTNGSTAYYQTAFTIDGTSVTPKYSGGTAPASGNASSIDVYTYTIVKTASATYTVFGAGPIKYA
jgi:VCBS repeat-containing protein